ncbi:hypothetical protein [Dyadobacter luticola]|uniref:DUF3784 domain-containing protein n=1 Tax=Dyadobacter luticola TaxID=1979387 RepID=A0A5R9KZ33_9BACT|nr:hypothetical protein [Dyadobacter luticola]TLV01441.1 hypothetical protein FEN17_18605 [Dyadobacter luticola]
MDWFLVLIGVLLIGFGGYIWQFKNIRLLNNIPAGAHILDKNKAARLGGCYLILIGICMIGFGYVVENFSSQTIIIIVACFIPINMIVMVSYLVAQSRNMR